MLKLEISNMVEREITFFGYYFAIELLGLKSTLRQF